MEYGEKAYCGLVDDDPDEVQRQAEEEAYWQRMRDEGFWVDGEGWTDKAMREWLK